MANLAIFYPKTTEPQQVIHDLSSAAEPKRQSWAFCLEPELKLKIRSRSSV